MDIFKVDTKKFKGSIKMEKGDYYHFRYSNSFELNITAKKDIYVYVKSVFKEV